MLDSQTQVRRKTDEDLEVGLENGEVFTLDDVEWEEGERDMWDTDRGYEYGDPDDYTFLCGWIGNFRVDRDTLAAMTSYAHVESHEESKAGR